MNKSCQLAIFLCGSHQDVEILEYLKHSLRTIFSKYFFTQVLWPHSRHILDRLVVHKVSQTQLLDLVCLVWDVFRRDGDDFLLRIRLGIF